MHFSFKASNRSTAFKKKTRLVDAMKILKQSADGRKIISNYQQRPCLDDDTRNKIVKIILTKTFANNIVISRFWQADIADQLCNIFRNEKKVKCLILISENISLCNTDLGYIPILHTFVN